MIRPRARLGPQSAALSKICRRTLSLASRWTPLQELRNGELDVFRHEAYDPSKPAILPRGHFLGLPAIKTWFARHPDDAVGTCFNYDYLSKSETVIVPLEFTRLDRGSRSAEASVSFQRAEAPLGIFLEWTKHATLETPERLYLAQASFASLSQAMTEDLPIPEIVAKAGTGDVYDTNIWMGIAPTYTPLHRDPNPNLFVQLAGHKIVRMLPPDAGDKVFASVQQKLGRSASASFRGEEMMTGEEKSMLEAEVWDDSPEVNSETDKGYEAHVWDGDGLFIPKGWWHSIKGVDGGILASVNWWFR